MCIDASAIAVPISGVARNGDGTVTTAKTSPTQAMTFAAFFHPSPRSAVTPAPTNNGTTDAPMIMNQAIVSPPASHAEPAKLPIPKMTKFEMVAMRANRVTRIHEMTGVDVVDI